MKTLKLIGIDLQAAIQHTKTCLSDTLSPVKKDAVARSFLKRFLRAENEHTLSQHFTEEESQEQFIICFNELDFDSKIEAQMFTITNSTVLENDLETIFKAHFYFEEENIDQIIESELVDYFVSKNNLDGNVIANQLKQMDKKELLDWLITNFTIYQLVDNSFFCEVLNEGLSSIIVCKAFPPKNTVLYNYSNDTYD